MQLCYPCSLKAVVACDHPVYSLQTILQHCRELNAHHRWKSQCGGNVVYCLCPECLSFLLLSPSVCRGGLHPLCGPETERFESESEEEGKERALRINTHTSTGGKTWCERRCKPYGTIKPYTSHLVQQAVGVRTQVCSLPRVLLDTLMHGCLPNHRSPPSWPVPNGASVLQDMFSLRFHASAIHAAGARRTYLTPPLSPVTALCCVRRQ